MPALPKDALERMLRSKFHFVQEEGDHHHLTLVCGGTKVVRTMTSHSKGAYKTLGPELVSLIAKQLRLTSSQLRLALACEFSLADYIAHLERIGHIARGACDQHLRGR